MPAHEEMGAWINLLQARDAVVAEVERRLQSEAGISLAEHEVLFRLVSAPEERLRMFDLATLLLVSKSGVTRLVDRLVQEGWVNRDLSADDRRVVYAALTDEGRAKLRGSMPILANSVRDVFISHLSEDDVQDLRRVLRKLLEGRGVWTEERCAPVTSPVLDGAVGPAPLDPSGSRLISRGPDINPLCGGDPTLRITRHAR